MGQRMPGGRNDGALPVGQTVRGGWCSVGAYAALGLISGR
jgi:hypothetical protein